MSDDKKKSDATRASTVSSRGETAVGSEPEPEAASKETVEPLVSTPEDDGTGDKPAAEAVGSAEEESPAKVDSRKSSRLSKAESVKVPPADVEQEAAGAAPPAVKATSGGSVAQQKLVGFEEERTSAAVEEENVKGTLLDYFSMNSKPGRKSATATTGHGGGKPLRRPKLIYENTYQLDPHFPFSPSRVEPYIEMVLEEMFTGFSYTSEGSGRKAVQIAEKIRRHVLALHFSRFKVCVLVTISPIERQGFYSGFRCLWDVDRDSYASATCRSKSAFCVATVWGMYFE